MTSGTHHNALQPAAMVQWYRIERILGQGSFGITYLARDTNLDQPVAVKEYLPIDLAARGQDWRVHPISDDHEEHYRWGLERFIAEGKTIAQFNHPSIVRVYAVFEANNTAYMVMPHERGTTLSAVLRTRSTLPQDELVPLFLPVLDGLERIHDAGFIHRDIKPANIFIRKDRSPVLLDFGSARQALGGSDSTLTALVSPGYAPFEQYSSKTDDQGPWTDIYSLAATLYRCVSGSPPVDAAERSSRLLLERPDPLIPATEVGKGRYAGEFLRAIDHGLAFRIQDRPQSVAEWREHFVSLPAAPAPDEAPTPTSPAHEVADLSSTLPVPSGDEAEQAESEQPAGRRALSGRWLGIAAGVLLVVGLGGVAWRHLDVSAPPFSGGPFSEGEADLQASAEEELEVFASADPPALDEEPGGDGELGGPPLPFEWEASDDDVGRLLTLANDAFARGNLSSPEGDNAHYYYREALALDPGNKVARRGIDRVVSRYVTLAEGQLAKDNYAGAREYVAEGLALEPEARPLLEVKEEVAKSVEVDRLLALAERALEDYRLTTPAEDNAYYYYHKVLELDPDNQQAKQGSEEIAKRYAWLAKSYIDKTYYSKAREYIARGLEIEPEHERLLALRESIEGKSDGAGVSAGMTARRVSGEEASDDSFVGGIADAVRGMFEGSGEPTAEPRRDYK